MPKRQGKASPELQKHIERFIQAPGFGECTQLCDVVVLDQVCDQIPDAFHVLRNGGTSFFRQSLRTDLYEPLSRYAEELERERVELFEEWSKDMQKALPGQQTSEYWQREAKRRMQQGSTFIGIELEATTHLRHHLDELEDQFENGPWSEQDAAEAEQTMRFAWYRWIASIAYARVQFTLPREKARAHMHGKMANKDGSAGRPANIERNKNIVAAVDRLRPKLDNNVWSRVASDFGVSVTHVKNLYRKSAEQKPETKPAG